MTRVSILLLLTVLLTLQLALVPALAAAERPATADYNALPAQAGEPGGKMGHTPWEGTNWGLIAAFAYSTIVLATAIVLLSVILSWPHRRR